MTISVVFKEEFDRFFSSENVQRYEIDTKTGFLKINYDCNKTIYIKLREILYFKIVKGDN